MGRPALQLIGKKFGKLTVISRDIDFINTNGNKSSKWLCICICGNKSSVLGYNLSNGSTKSCGSQRMCGPRTTNLVNRRFGKLTVVSHINTKFQKNESTKWLCKCDCGENKEVYGKYLLRGKAKSCGCLHKFKDPTEASRNVVLGAYIKGAKKRDLIFKLTDDQFNKLINANCFYCNREPSNFKNKLIINNKPKQSKTIVYSKKDIENCNFYYNGIDRVNNNIGYIEKNCVTCCFICNRAKSDMTFNSFINYLDDLSKFRRKG